MTTLTRDHIERAIQRCRERGDDVALEDAAQRALRTLPAEAVRLLALHCLVGEVRARERASTLAVERASEVPDVVLETVRGGPRSMRRDRPAYWAWVESTEEGRAYEAERQVADAVVRDRFNQSIRRSLNHYTESLRLEWSRELLNATFALPDGTQVTWGEATVAQHESRAVMFEQNAVTNLEGAARHRAAIRDCEAVGAVCLDALVAQAA